MNDALSFESNLSILIEQPSSINFPNLQSTLDSINQFCNSKDGLIFIINNIPNFQKITSKKFSIIVCKNWCLHKWVEIPNELKNHLKSLLFSFLIQQFDGIPQDIQYIIGDAQFSFFWNTYPSQWPSFWDELFQMHPLIILNFLNSFSSYTSTLNYDSNDTFELIKSSIRNQNADAIILTFIIKLLNTPNTNSQLPLRILASFIHWMPLNYILDNNTMSTIINALNNPTTTSSALDALTALIERGMESEMKLKIIDSLQIPPRIKYLICNNADDTILYSAAQLIENTGSFLISHSIPKSEIFFQISLQLLTNMDNNISGCVAPFIQQYTQRNPEVSSIVLNVSYTRLKDYYLNTYSADLCVFNESPEDEAYCEMIFGIVRSCFQVNHDDSLYFLLSICDSMDVVEEMPHCIALIEILNDVQPQPEFVKYFEPLLSLFPPLSPSQTKALGCYVRFFSSVSESFEASALSTFFVRISEFSLSPMLNEETRSILSLSLLGFTKKCGNVFFNQQMISSFVQSTDPNLIQLAAILASRLEASDFIEAFQSCVTHLFGKLQSDQRFCPFVFSFIKGMNYVQGSPHIPVIQKFLSQIQPFVKSSDQLQAQFIMTCFSALGPESNKLISDCIVDSKERLSIAALCEVATAIVKRLTNQTNIDFSLNLLNHLYDSFASCFNEIGDWSIINDDSFEIVQMVNNYLTLTAAVIQKVSSDFLSKIFVFVSTILKSSSKYFCYQLLSKLMSFVYHASQCFPKETLQFFGSLSLSSFISNRNFHPTHPGWSKVILKVVNFHASLLEKIPNETVQLIAQTFTNEKATPEMIQSYIALFKVPPKMRNDHSIEFFEAFMKYKKSLC